MSDPAQCVLHFVGPLPARRASSWTMRREMLASSSPPPLGRLPSLPSLDISTDIAISLPHSQSTAHRSIIFPERGKSFLEDRPPKGAPDHGALHRGALAQPRVGGRPAGSKRRPIRA